MNKPQNKYFQLVPEKVLKILPELEQSLKDIPGFSSDNLKQIISELAIHMREEKIMKSCYLKQNVTLASLKIVYLRNIVPQADQYLKQLLKLGIIKRYGYARIGVSAFKYKFSEPYESKYLRLPLINSKLFNRIAKFQQSMKKQNSKRYPDQNQFIRALTIDHESLEYIKKIEEENEYNYAVSSVTKILNGDIFYKVDTTSYRFHSNLTNLPKELRRFVRINGIQLSNIDIKNSQPFLSTILLINPAKVAHLAKNYSFRMLLENLHVNQTEDVNRYISLVVEGNIYEYLWNEFTLRGLIINSRAEVKRQVLIILFARNLINPPARKIFKELFPEVHRIFTLIRGYDKGNKFTSFERFAILLQRIESYIILDLILTRIYKEYPGTIAVTIHDSIMTSLYTDHVDKVKKIMTEELEKYIGYEPTLKIE